MALSSRPDPALIEDSSLTDWKVIDSGGFGQVHKARHRVWCFDVAIKLLHYDDGSSTYLLREIDMMRKGSCPYVIQVLGLFRGRIPSSGPSTQLGLVMELMERGSLASLQKTLCTPAPWPLVFRLAHQVALGINFLHSLRPALLHLDLKPSNVLLDSYLDAKLTDFGLSRCYYSVSRLSKKDGEQGGGTTNYMPPEAFENLSYRPTQASDIYSYGMLLWSIAAGEKPYANAESSIVRIRIPKGDRPLLDKIRIRGAGVAGSTRLMDLMKRCWELKPEERPSSHYCATETEELYKMHKNAINDAVHQVLKMLDPKEEQSRTEQVQRVHITQTSASNRSQAANVDDVPTGPPPIQEMDDHWTGNERGRSRLKDPNLHRPTRGHCSVNSVHPIQSSPTLSSTGRSLKGRGEKLTLQAFRQNQAHTQFEDGMNSLLKRGATGFERQFSSPDAIPLSSARGVHIHASNVTGVQTGNNNVMHITAPDPGERRRHPTAPPSVNLLLPHPGSSRHKAGDN